MADSNDRWDDEEVEYGIIVKQKQFSIINDTKVLKDSNIFIGDTGTTSDTTNSRYGFTNVREATKQDNIVDASGMVHMPGTGYNMFSLTKGLDQGWSLGGNSEKIWLQKGTQRAVFDTKIKTPKIAIYIIYLKCKVASSEKMATMGTDRSKPIYCKVVHTLMGYINEEDNCKSIQCLGYDTARGAMDVYQACAEAKAKRCSLPTRVQISRMMVQPKEKSKTVNEQLSFDISTVKVPADVKTTVTKPQWLIMVEEHNEIK
eukprot:12098561-Ditylum_brightwellii.AAC.1